MVSGGEKELLTFVFSFIIFLLITYFMESGYKIGSIGFSIALFVSLLFVIQYPSISLMNFYQTLIAILISLIIISLEFWIYYKQVILEKREEKAKAERMNAIQEEVKEKLENV